MSNSPSENILPNWLNKTYFENILREYKKDDTIAVKNIISDKEYDEHYGSKMYCLILEFSSKKSKIIETLKIVIKAKPEPDDPMSKAFENSPIIDIEINMYLKIIPLINDLLNRYGMMKGHLAPE